MKVFDESVLIPLEKFFRELTGAGSFKDDVRTQDFCFHMTDWFDDAKDLISLMERPSQANQEKWNQVIQQFLGHASGHIAIAAKLAQVKPVDFAVPKDVEGKSGGSVRKAS